LKEAPYLDCTLDKVEKEVKLYKEEFCNYIALLYEIVKDAPATLDEIKALVDKSAALKDNLKADCEAAGLKFK